MTEGDIWFAIRRLLPDLSQDMAKAINAQSHEEACIYFDGIARKLASAVKEFEKNDRTH